MERKGAAYSIKSKRPAQDQSGHEQVTRMTGRISAGHWTESARRNYDEPDPDRMRDDLYDREWEERYG